MSENSPQQSPSPSTPPKKGLPAIAWVGIGCGGFVILMVIIVVIGVMFIWGKAKTTLEEYAENPALVQAKIMALANPNIDIVSEDEAAGTITVRDKETGETYTLDSAAGFAEGMMSFQTEEGEEVVFDEEGLMTVTAPEERGQSRQEGDGGADESKRIQITSSFYGAGIEEGFPEWVVKYPGAVYGIGSGTRSETTMSAYTTFTSDDQPETIINYYRERLERQGFAVNVRSVSNISSLNAHTTEPNRQISFMVVPAEDGSQVTMSFSGDI